MIASIEKPKTKVMWNELLTSLSDPMEKDVRVFSKPRGIFCHVYLSEDGAAVLDNYHRIFLDEPIATALTKAGYEGRIVIYRDMPPVAISRWLTYQISNNPEGGSWLDTLTVFTFGDLPEGDLPFACRSVSPTVVKAGNVIHLNTTRSKDREYDGLYVVDGDNEYHILPSRSCSGLVVAVDGKTLVVHVELPQGVRPIRAKYEGSSPESVVGLVVRVKYTESTYTNCLNNLTSAVVHEIKSEED